VSATRSDAAVIAADPQEPKPTRAWRRRLLERLEDRLEAPMVVLGLVWLAIVVAELLYGDSPALRTAGVAIWVVFILDFLLRLTLAPNKARYLRSSWITMIALALPAFRVLRFGRLLRALRGARGIRLARLVTSVNRGMRSLAKALERRGFGYVAALTFIVLTAGAAGMYAFERASPTGGFRSYAEALWWTAMLLTTSGSDRWPATPEGRALALLLSIYALGVLGYITATLASFFVGRDAGEYDPESGRDRTLRDVQQELAALREEIRFLGRHGDR
jgi:voltage-gated potassium channel